LSSEGARRNRCRQRKAVVGWTPHSSAVFARLLPSIIAWACVRRRSKGERRGCRGRSEISVGSITAAARAFGLPAEVRIAAGTTDGCASFLATGARTVGDGVTALGTSLTLKLLSDKPIFAPRYGVYSHRLLDMWLAGGASNSGGAALLAHFSPDEIEALTPLIDPEADSGHNCYPLTGKGERFPIADPDFPPRMAPRPESREEFLHAILEAIAGVEALGYRRLAELGAPVLVSVRTVGGGARNPAWTRIRERKLGVPFIEPISSEAAYGAALLAMRAWGR
jgi:sugar (pentulose or hexulose) kinase